MTLRPRCERRETLGVLAKHGLRLAEALETTRRGGETTELVAVEAELHGQLPREQSEHAEHELRLFDGETVRGIDRGDHHVLHRPDHRRDLEFRSELHVSR